ncbi:MAG: pilus assembly protein [Oscillospiraceae bacterium]|nr:pilus assembly protein [Oscillospiraceae bacterium]
MQNKSNSDFWRDENGDAVIEATILFPIMVLIFFALVLLSVYLPTRAVLQRAAQYTVVAMATERSDTWIYFNESSMRYGWHTDRSELDDVYVAALKSELPNSNADKAQTIAAKAENRVVLTPAGGGTSDGNLEVSFGVVNYIVYKEIIVTATRTIPMPLNLSLINFPSGIPITVTSTAVVQNGNEFVRNMDIAADFVNFADEKYNISSDSFAESVEECWAKVRGFLGI